MQSDYQPLVRNESSRGLLRELGLGIALLTAIVLGCMLLPEMPGEFRSQAVGSAPPVIPASPHPEELPGIGATEF